MLDFRSEQFGLILIYKSPHYFLQSFKSICLSVQEKKRKIDSQDGRHGGHLEFLIWRILAIFDLLVTQMLPTKFKVNWPFISGEAAKNRFSRGLPWRPSWISDWNSLSYFWSTSRPDASYQVSIHLAFLPWRSSSKYIFKTATMAGILDFRLERF